MYETFKYYVIHCILGPPPIPPFNQMLSNTNIYNIYTGFVQNLFLLQQLPLADRAHELIQRRIGCSFDKNIQQIVL